MIITLNGESKEIGEDTTVRDLIKNLDCRGTLAVFVNSRKLLMVEYKDHMIVNGDNVKIKKHLIGG